MILQILFYIIHRNENNFLFLKRPNKKGLETTVLVDLWYELESSCYKSSDQTLFDLIGLYKLTSFYIFFYDGH